MHSTLRLHGVVLNELSTGTTLPLPYYVHGKLIKKRLPQGETESWVAGLSGTIGGSSDLHIGEWQRESGICRCQVQEKLAWLVFSALIGWASVCVNFHSAWQSLWLLTGPQSAGFQLYLSSRFLKSPKINGAHNGPSRGLRANGRLMFVPSCQCWTCIWGSKNRSKIGRVHQLSSLIY
jgi:hypothetical protein